MTETICQSSMRRDLLEAYGCEVLTRCGDCIHFANDERMFGDEWMPVKVCELMHDSQGECLMVDGRGYCWMAVPRD